VQRGPALHRAASVWGGHGGGAVGWEVGLGGTACIRGRSEIDGVHRAMGVCGARGSRRRGHSVPAVRGEGVTEAWSPVPYRGIRC
jgi:hypothetical protein